MKTIGTYSSIAEDTYSRNVYCKSRSINSGVRCNRKCRRCNGSRRTINKCVCTRKNSSMRAIATDSSIAAQANSRYISC